MNNLSLELNVKRQLLEYPVESSSTEKLLPTEDWSVAVKLLY